jgi:hypothetical protein
MSQYVAAPKTMTSGETMERATLVKYVSGGTVKYCDAGDTPMGYITNAVVTSGDPVAVHPIYNGGTFQVQAAGAITAGASVYTADNGEVNDSVSGVHVGIALTTSTAQGDIIEVMAIPQQGGLIYSSTAASTAVTNTTTETAFDTAVTIPAGALQAGDVIRIRFQGIATATNSTDTLAIKAYIGTVEVYAIAAIDVADDDIFSGDVEVVVRTVGATGTCVAFGHGVTDAQTTGAEATSKASQTLNTTIANSVAVKATWSVANAGNSCRLDIMNVELLRAGIGA